MRRTDERRLRPIAVLCALLCCDLSERLPDGGPAVRARGAEGSTGRLCA